VHLEVRGMKCLWLGPGLVLVRERVGFRAAGRTEIVELDDGRATLLIGKGLATDNLALRGELEPLDAAEVEEIKTATQQYNRVRAVIAEDLEMVKGALATRKAMGATS